MPHRSESVRTRLAAAGRKLFGNRLLIGLAVAAIGIELLSPQPLFANGQRLIHGFALFLVLAGLSLRAWGSGSAGRHTRSETIEAPELVTSGPFAYVRNPIYIGSLCLGVGMSLLIGDPLALLLTALAFAILYPAIVPAEEEFLLSRFGTEYLRYRKEVPRLIPRLRPWPGRVRKPFNWSAVRGELFIGLLLIGIYGTLLIEEHLDGVSP